MEFGSNQISDENLCHVRPLKGQKRVTVPLTAQELRHVLREVLQADSEPWEKTVRKMKSVIRQQC